MPRGYYLGQGLIPLGYHSSDDEEGPCELPDGRVVCGPHGLVVCGKCCSDYSYMDDSEEDEEDEYPEPPDTGPAFPSRFAPPVPGVPPLSLFTGRFQFGSVVRCTLHGDRSKLLLVTDGACLNNGQPDPKAGWAFLQGYSVSGQPLLVSGRLEAKGPSGNTAVQSSNRAELRAIIAALTLRHWPGEGFQTVVIATDSEYVVDGATKWVKTWTQNGWKTAKKEPVKNKDLWEKLLGLCEKARANGLAVQFWAIPREWNTLVDAEAKKAAAEAEAPASWEEVHGLAM